jgi:hypothetical protein
MVKYDHAFSLGFSVVTDNDGESVTAQELHTALLNRIDDLVRNNELVEACGCPDDTIEVDDD